MNCLLVILERCRSEMHFINGIEWKLLQKERMKNGKLSPEMGKVSAELTKGASWSRNERMQISVSKILK